MQQCVDELKHMNSAFVVYEDEWNVFKLLGMKLPKDVHEKNLVFSVQGMHALTNGQASTYGELWGPQGHVFKTVETLAKQGGNYADLIQKIVEHLDKTIIARRKMLMKHEAGYEPAGNGAVKNILQYMRNRRPSCKDCKKHTCFATCKMYQMQDLIYQTMSCVQACKQASIQVYL
jgi:hypothetical protein